MENEVETHLMVEQKKCNVLSRIANTPPVDIEFQDLKYSIRDSGEPSGFKHILNSISGKFISGDFTAILGPSGAGKSTLLNVLAGYVRHGISGTIKINDKPREMKIFNKLSAYIMQEDLLQPKLSVFEAMMIAANLKLGPNVTKAEKENIVREVLDVLGLKRCTDTRTERLSGGQKKRVSVALELVNNPPVIFLDEPTTGLDSVAIKQCINVLKTLTNQGRTIICTIHQPPASIFEQFDQVYFLANGLCTYNGAANKLVDFLSSAGISCPTTYNPADHLIELIHMESDITTMLSTATENGKRYLRLCNADTTSEYSVIKKKETTQIALDASYAIYKETTEPITIDNANIEFPTSFFVQFWILLKRMMLIKSRSHTALKVQLIHHILSGLLVGSIFYKVGQNGSLAISNFFFCLCEIVFFMYTHTMTSVLMFPTEVQIVKREYFNRWYSLKAYYAAVVIRNIPLVIILGSVYIAITYAMSQQPSDIKSITLSSIVLLLVAINSEAFGLAIGAMFNIMNGSAVAPSSLAPLLFFSIYGMGYGTKLETFMQYLIGVSYLRYGVVGMCSSLLEFRDPLPCDDEIYCHYRDPKILLRDMGVLGHTYSGQVFALVLFLFIHYFIGFLALWYRLKSDLKSTVAVYMTKLFQLKRSLCGR